MLCWEQIPDGLISKNESGMGEALECDVVVIGMGPIGAATALALGGEGLVVAVVEPSLLPFDKPRAIGIDHDTLRLLQRFGVMDEFAPQLGEYRPTEYRAASGEVLRRIRPQPLPHPQAWPPYSTFVQPELEAILRKACAANPRIDLRLGWAATSFAETDAGVEVVIASAAGDGPVETLRCQYVVACDGARSPVREALGARIDDLDFDEQWLVVDVIVEDATAQLPDVTVQYCNAQRPATFIAGPGALRRWEIMLLPGEDGAEMAREEKVWELLSPWLTPAQGKLWRAASYRFHALVVEQWRWGKVFLAGDAAHQTPPFMAQGLNQGFRDVANLAWKLGLVLRGGASPDILDTYTSERRPNVASVIALTKHLGRIICECDPVRAAQRNRVMLAEMADGRGDVVRQDLLPPLEPGELVMAGPRFGVTAGTTFPQPVIRSGSGTARMDDVLGSGVQLFVTAAAGELAGSAGVKVIHVDGIGGRGTIEETEGLLRGWFARHGLCAALVRPDRVVFGTAATPEDAADLISMWDRAIGSRGAGGGK